MVAVDGSDKYDRILEAAEKVFEQNGYTRATVEAIAAAAGVGKGTVYLYFKNKQDVFLSVLEDRVAKHLALLDAQLKDVTTPRQVLTTIVVQTVEFFRAHQGMMSVLWEAFRFADNDWRLRLLKCNRAINDRLVVYITRMVGPNSAVSGYTVLDVAMGAVRTVLAGKVLRNEPIEPGKITEEIVALLLPGILGVQHKLCGVSSKQENA